MILGRPKDVLCCPCHRKSPPREHAMFSSIRESVVPGHRSASQVFPLLREKPVHKPRRLLRFLPRCLPRFSRYLCWRRSALCRSRCRSCPSALQARAGAQFTTCIRDPFLNPLFRLCLFLIQNTTAPQLQQPGTRLTSHCPTMAELASCTIYIKGIATTATEADIRDSCSQYGNITEVAIPEGKDFCFVEFAEEAQAQVGPRPAQTRRFGAAGSEETESTPTARSVGIAIRVQVRCPCPRPARGSIFC